MKQIFWNVGIEIYEDGRVLAAILRYRKAKYQPSVSYRKEPGREVFSLWDYRGSLLVSGVALGYSFFGHGRPRIPPSFITSTSSSRYKPAEPIYRKGRMPFLWNRLITAEEEIPRRWAISTTVIPSIYYSIATRAPANQAQMSKYLKLYTLILYSHIVNPQKNSKNFCQTLDYPLGRVYIVYMSRLKDNRTA
jgi:hypothetical protein